MQTSPEQTLMLLMNNPAYTRKIKAAINLMKYESSIRTPKKHTSLPPYLKDLTDLSALFSQDSKLEFSYGEILLGKLKDLFMGAVKTLGEDIRFHQNNFNACAHTLLSHRGYLN